MEKIMSLIHELKIGLFNAWLPLLFFNILMMALPYLISKEGAKRAVDTSWYEKKDKIMMILSFVFWYGLLIYSIWIPLKTGTVWFYTGLIIILPCLVCYIIANHNYMSAPPGKAITKGMYKISRHPLYVFSSFILTSIFISSASWSMLFITTVYMIITHQLVKAEEQYCLRKYGDEYHKYMNSVPRYLIFF